MKIRCGFVTNSSSSSFILAYKELPKLEPEILEAHPELGGYDSLIQNALEEEDWRDDEDKAYVFTDMESFHDFFCEEYLSEDSWYRAPTTLVGLFEAQPELKKLYDDAKKYIDEGYRVVFRKFPYSKDVTDKIIRGLIKSKKILLISPEREY